MLDPFSLALVTRVTVVMGDLDAAEPENLHDGPVKSKL